MTSYFEDEWRASAGHRPLMQLELEDLMLLHRHWMWAPVLFEVHEEALRKMPIEPAAVEAANSPWSRESTFMFVFCGLLYSVIEAAVAPAEKRRIELRGRFREDIDAVSEKLRLCRNAILHVPRDGSYWDERISKFITTEGIIAPIVRVHRGLGRLISRRSGDEQNDTMYPDAMAENEERRPVPAPCVQCGKAGVQAVSLDGSHWFNVCFEHLQQHEELRLRKIEFYAARAQEIEDQIDDTWGLPRRPRPQPTPRVNVQQIHIHGNNLGVVNTGTVQTIANNVTAINQADPALARHLQQLAEGILASNDLTDDDKRDAADLLNEVVADAAKSPAQRSPRAVMQTIANGLGQVLSKAAQLAALWKAIEPHLAQ